MTANPVPTYEDGSIVNLMSSITAALGDGPGAYGTLGLLEPAELREAKNVVLFVIDGLGFEYLQRHGAGGTLHERLRGRLSSVFPTTTAAAITTFVTGVAPRQHGLTGWFMLLKELGAVTAILPLRTRGAGLPLPLTAANGIYDQPALFSRLSVQSYVITHKRIVDSMYSTIMSAGAQRLAYHGLPECFAQIRRALAEGDRRKYVYAYWPDLDSLAHEYGIESPEVAAHFEQLDRGFADFLDSIQGTDTTVIVTADHGLVDTSPDQVIRVEDHPVLAEALALPLCGEPRVAYCYVRPSRARTFEDYVNDVLQEHCVLYRSEDLVDRGYFGLGDSHPRLQHRIGDYVMLAKGNRVIKDQVLGEHPFSQTGVHGGLSRDELYVPLIVERV